MEQFVRNIIIFSYDKSIWKRFLQNIVQNVMPMKLLLHLLLEPSEGQVKRGSIISSLTRTNNTHYNSLQLDSVLECQGQYLIHVISTHLPV